ncbi:MAG: YggT family protein [Clostridiaceae bacterium]|nr:YggT family protein [Clostridiaceae bacterium]
MNSSLASIVLQSLDLVFVIIFFIIFVNAIVSWFPIPKDSIFMRLLYQTTEPILAPIRSRLAKTSFGKNSMIDLSSSIAMLIIIVLRFIISIFIEMVLG